MLNSSFSRFEYSSSSGSSVYLSSLLAFVFLSNASLNFQALIIALAGGGVLAMVLQTTVPEAYKGTHEQVSIFGAMGFSSIFVISKLFGTH